MCRLSDFIFYHNCHNFRPLNHQHITLLYHHHGHHHDHHHGHHHDHHGQIRKKNPGCPRKTEGTWVLWPPSVQVNLSLDMIMLQFFWKWIKTQNACHFPHNFGFSVCTGQPFVGYHPRMFWPKLYVHFFPKTNIIPCWLDIFPPKKIDILPCWFLQGQYQRLEGERWPPCMKSIWKKILET